MQVVDEIIEELQREDERRVGRERARARPRHRADHAAARRSRSRRSRRWSSARRVRPTAPARAGTTLDAGASFDPVRMYLKEIGKVPLLTAAAGGQPGQAVRGGSRRRTRRSSRRRPVTRTAGEPARGRPRRRTGEEPADRGQPAARGVDREAIRRTRDGAARPRAGGQPRAHPRGREVRLHEGLGLLDYRATGELYRNSDVGLALTVSKHPSYLPWSSWPAAFRWWRSTTPGVTGSCATRRTRCWPSAPSTTSPTSSSGCAPTRSCGSGSPIRALRGHRRSARGLGHRAGAHLRVPLRPGRATRLTPVGGRAAPGVLLVTPEPLGERMRRGPAVRCVELAPGARPVGSRRVGNGRVRSPGPTCRTATSRW